MPRVVLAMSGGVDSSAAAVLLQEQGYEVIGLFMRSGATGEQVCGTGPDQAEQPAAADDLNLPVVAARSHRQGCCSASDAADARRVADMLDIPFHALNFQDAFGRIKDYFADEYLAGRTPNPCVMCNNWLKFGKLWDFAQQVGAEFIATGHYARLGTGRRQFTGNGEAARNAVGARMSDTPVQPASPPAVAAVKSGPTLGRGLDPAKDQSYVLFGINRNLLDRIIFPVGMFEKRFIREKALQSGLRVFDKPDSQEICFIPDNDYAGFIERFRGRHETAGSFVDTAGNVLGQHSGYERFTIGQRRGIGLAFGEPRYVVGIRPESREVVIGTHAELGKTKLHANRINWLIDDVPAGFRCLAQIRYRHQAASCRVTVAGEDRFDVEFDEPQFGVAPGQAVVLYEDDRVLGGGWIL